jgi:hypothetical protein
MRENVFVGEDKGKSNRGGVSADVVAVVHCLARSLVEMRTEEISRAELRVIRWTPGTAGDEADVPTMFGEFDVETAVLAGDGRDFVENFRWKKRIVPGAQE